jgi:hypothetical protein
MLLGDRFFKDFIFTYVDNITIFIDWISIVYLFINFIYFLERLIRNAFYYMIYLFKFSLFFFLDYFASGYIGIQSLLYNVILFIFFLLFSKGSSYILIFILFFITDSEHIINLKFQTSRIVTRL